MKSPLHLFVCLLATVFVYGCDTSLTPEQLLAQARQYRSKGELNAALIQAKNAAHLSPDLADAHYLVGATYLDLGEASLAEQELRQALALNGDAQAVIPSLAKSLVKQGKYQDVLDETVPERFPATARSADVASSRGTALLMLKRIPAAKAAYEEALGYEADFSDALVGLAKITAADRRPQEALQLLDRAIAKSPSNLDALLLQGDLQRVVGNPHGALLAYHAAVRAAKLKPDELNARLTLASVQIALNKVDDATANLTIVRTEVPESPTANYLQAVIEFRKKNFAAAQSLAVEVLKAQPGHMPSVILAGAAEYAIGKYPLAEGHLKSALDRYPDSLYVRKLLIATYIKGGKNQLAAETLQPGLKQAPRDASLLELAGEVYMQARQFTRATQYFDMAVRIEPDSVGKRIAASASRIASGQADQAIVELESVVAEAPTQRQAGILLALANLHRGQFDKVLGLIGPLETAMPRNPIPRNLKGSAYLGKKDYARARRAFEEALALDASYFPAAANLAQLDIDEKNIVAARSRFDAVLARDDSNVQAMVALAELLTRMPGQAQESMQWIERARQLQPNDARIAVSAAKYQLAAGNRALALETARQASTLGASDLQVLHSVAQLQLAAGATRDALETYGTVARLAPTSAEAQYRVASLQYLLVNSAVARQTLRKALELDPNHREALNLLAKLEADGGNRDAALRLAEKVKKLAPKSASGFVLEGDIEMLSKRYGNATKAYERAYSIEKSGMLVAQIYQADLRAGKPDAAESVVLQWLQQNPTDAKMRLYLADASLQAGRLATAVAQYEWLAQNGPANQQVLNNLAWAYNESADPRAIATAERAFRLNESNPAVADTYGLILYRNAQYSAAVGVLERAASLAPKSPEIRYHYAQALAKTGDRRKARLELERVLSAPTSLEARTKAKSLLDDLKN